jgi:hypothetical protein
VIRPTFLLAIVLGFPTTISFAADKPGTPPLAFVTEYVRELGEIERIRAAGEDEIKKATDEDRFAIMIHTSTAMQLALRSHINMMKSMNLKPPVEEAPLSFAKFYEQKIDLHQSLIDISSAFMGGPKPDIDYAKLAAELPKVRASLEFIDRAIFEATPLVFTALIDMKADSKGHVSHLVITKAERANLLSNLADRFGTKLDQKGSNFIVGSAVVLRGGLLKNFKCSDEPWE